MKDRIYNHHTDKWVEVEVGSSEYYGLRFKHWLHNVWDDWGFVPIFLMCILILCLAVLVPFYFADRYACRVDGEVLGVQTVYNWISGCYYKVDGTWVTEDMFKVIFMK